MKMIQFDFTAKNNERNDVAFGAQGRTLESTEKMHCCMSNVAAPWRRLYTALFGSAQFDASPRPNNACAAPDRVGKYMALGGPRQDATLILCF